MPKLLKAPIARRVNFSTSPAYFRNWLVIVISEETSNGWVLCLANGKPVYIPAANLATDEQMAQFYASLKWPPPPSTPATTTAPTTTAPTATVITNPNPQLKIINYPAKAISTCSFTADLPNTVSILHGETVTVKEPEQKRWILIEKEDGTQGYVPSTHITIL